MKVVIVEDEKLAAERLEQLLLNIDPKIQVVQKLESVEESINWVSQNSGFDLVFMDIQLDDGISFEIFDAIEIGAPVIFTTAFNEYAIRAFKVNSVDYLLKPIDETALANAIQKFNNLFSGQLNFGSKISNVFKQLSQTYKERFFVKVGVHYQSVRVKDIECFFVERKCTFLKTKNGRTYDLDQSLDQIQKLVDPG
ncbi:MAG TPA: response regulator, partial [Prolixibacteraceae bacterium]|nr:response regulator [Prolixibacteraceae bacterium]